ncbi:septum formation initiator family protein [Flavobacteriaceae bacterium]|nr:septum formation initiator family protein [Flavobacteriaceae bacterium]MDB4289554.1 septum formation initiator family protein [Flavobacteriaceae bacterium]MDB9874490.1 septum formation initiator family protein [Flavobacteriaceae bacterium]MDC1265551.1 septum formation initiator family protein [Flavobacteriaceae bacterium]
MLKKSNRFLKLLKPFKNIYFLILIVFIVWMVIFDANSWLIHSDLNEDMEDLNSKIEFYNGEIEKDQKEINTLNSTDGIEKYAREHYKMKKENEVVYIIEDADSLKVKTNE